MAKKNTTKKRTTDGKSLKPRAKSPAKSASSRTTTRRYSAHKQDFENARATVEPELGIEDAELGMICLSRPVAEDECVYRDERDRELFSIKELVVNGWPFNKNEHATIHGYRKDIPPLLCFVWQHPDIVKLSSNTHADMEHASSFIWQRLEDDNILGDDVAVFSQQWRTATKSSWELARERKDKEPRYLAFDVWESDTAFFEAGGLLQPYPTVRQCLDLYCTVTHRVYGLFGDTLSYLQGMTATSAFTEYRRSLREASARTASKIFVSYSHKYKPEVDKVLSALRASEIGFWYDEHEIALGDFVDTKIESGIADSIGFLFFVSPDISDRFYPRSELALATARSESQDGYFIVPVLLANIAELKIPLEVARRRFIQVLDSAGNLLEDAVDRLKIDLVSKNQFRNL